MGKAAKIMIGLMGLSVAPVCGVGLSANAAPMLLSPAHLLLLPVAPLPPAESLLPDTSKALLPSPVTLPGADPSLWPTGLLTTPKRDTDPSLHMIDWSKVFNVARLGEFIIPLRTDPAERTNILLSAAAVDGITIAPGETFSFNDAVGERTPERGYQDGWMFDQGHLVRGTGGGICLVATGLYNAAMQAGLDLVERHPHSGVVGYAPPGCDAGIAWGVEDMKFRNSTSAPIVVKTHAEDTRVVVQLFGQTPPRGHRVFVKATHFQPLPYKVIEEPDATLPPGTTVVEQKARPGYDVTVERFWTVGDEIVRREVVAQEHRAPRNKIVRVPLPQTTTPAPLPQITTPPAATPVPPPAAETMPVAPASPASPSPAATPPADILE